ncbi:MAG: helix-turn-helix domain-containing protein [Roseimicrobium sp.]
MPASSESSEKQLAERAAAILLQNLADPPSLEELASEVGLSPFRLSRIFGDAIGKTIPGLLRHHRMQRAAQMLHETRTSIGEIAVTVGYHSMSAFCRAFERELQTTPSEYRQRNR